MINKSVRSASGPDPVGVRARRARAAILLSLLTILGVVVPAGPAHAATPQGLFDGVYQSLRWSDNTPIAGWETTVTNGHATYTQVPSGQECMARYPVFQDTVHAPDRSSHGYFRFTTSVQDQSCPRGQVLTGRTVTMSAAGNQIRLYAAEWPWQYLGRDAAPPPSDCGLTWETVFWAVNSLYQEGMAEADATALLAEPQKLCGAEVSTTGNGVDVQPTGAAEDKGGYRCQVFRTREGDRPGVGMTWLNNVWSAVSWDIQQDVCWGRNEVFSPAGPKNVPAPAYFVNVTRADNWFTKAHNCTTSTDAGTVVASGWTDTTRQAFFTTRSVTVNCPSRFGISFSLSGKNGGAGVSVNTDGSVTVTTTMYVVNQGDGTVKTLWIWGPRTQW